MTRPDGLKAPGERLWDQVLDGLPDGWELDERELAVLELAARQADVLADLEEVVERDGPMATGSTGQDVVNPAVVEARQARLAIDRLLGKISLPVPEKDGETANSTRARAGARQRRVQDARRKARRGAA